MIEKAITDIFGIVSFRFITQNIAENFTFIAESPAISNIKYFLVIPSDWYVLRDFFAC